MKSKTVNFLLIALLLSYLSLFINDAYSQSIDQLKIKLENCLRENDIPGAAVAVVAGDSVLFTGGFGQADIKKNIPVTENTHFWLGSISKSFTALGIMKLVEEGKVDLNVPIREILPKVNIQNPWEDTYPLRLVHLLEHTAGLCDGTSTTFNWRHDPNIPLEEVARLYGRIIIYHRPGSFYLYSNTGYLLAGMVLEKIAQMKYEEFLRREILTPLGMKTTTFDPTEPYNLSVLAQGYGSGGKEIPLLHAYQRPAAHTYGSVSDMTHYLMLFLNQGKYKGVQILKPESVKRIETPKTALASIMGLLNGYGLGNEWAFRNQHKWRGHNGAGFGYYSDFWYNRDLNIGYVVLVNQFDTQSAGNVRKLRELIAEHLTENNKPLFQPMVSVPKERLEAYCGTYAIGYGARDLLGLINFILAMTEVRLSGDILSIRQPLAGYEENILPVSNGLFRKKDIPEATVAFFTTPDGAKAMVRGRDYLQEQAPWKFWLVISFLIWAAIVMLSTVLYAIFWVPVSVYKKVSKKLPAIPWASSRTFSLAAVLALIAGFILIAKQDLYLLGKLTFASMSFFISTWLFAILSIVGLVSAIKSLKRPVKKILKIYSMVTACTYVGMTIFLWYWGIIGMKLWM